MSNKLDAVFRKKRKNVIMTHVVGGYPDMESCEQIVLEMEKSGADMVEIQIPFSDPLADGPTIMGAGQRALEAGVRPSHCLELAERLGERCGMPLLMMTYCNIVYSMGIERFVSRCARAGISGLIIPDLPFDEDEGRVCLATIKAYGMYPIMVVSPDMELERLRRVLAYAEGFLYVTLKVGITGAGKSISPRGLEFIDVVRKETPLPIAAGFGISSPVHVKQLQGHVDASVIGSHIINLYNDHGLDEVSAFIRECKAV